MNTLSWIFVGIIGVSLALYFIFTFAKKITLIQNISASLLFPALGCLYIYFLLAFLPDSLHNIKLGLFWFVLLSISQILGNFFQKKSIKIISYFLFILSLGPLIILYKAIFIIHRIPLWINVLAGCSYVVIFFLFFILFIKKTSVKFYSFGILTLIPTCFIHFCCLLTLVYQPAPYSITRFVGTSALLGYLVFQLLNYSIIDLKLKKLISLMILLASSVLIALSNLMILY